MLSPGSLKWNGVPPWDPTTVASVVSSVSPPICAIRSMPVQNAFSPAPVSTTQRTLSRQRSVRQHSCSSRCISELNALCRSGRFIVTQATPSRSSYRSVSNSGNDPTRRLLPALGVDAGVRGPEGVAVQDVAHLGGIPLGGVALLVGGEELLTHPPRLVDAERVADHSDHLAAHGLGIIRGRPGDRGGRVAGIHAVERLVVLGVLHLDVGHGLADHPGDAAGPDAVGPYPVARQLEAGDDGHGGDPGVRRAVVDLAGLAREPGARDGVDDGRAGLATLFGLGAPVRRGVVHRVPGPVQVDLHDGVEVLGAHREHHSVAEDTGVVDQDVETTEVFEGGADDVSGTLEVSDAAVVGDGLAATRRDHVDYVVGDALAAAAVARHRAAEVVDDDLRAVLREEDGLASADAVSGAGDDRHLAVEDPHLRAFPPPLKTDAGVTVSRWRTRRSNTSDRRSTRAEERPQWRWTRASSGSRRAPIGYASNGGRG